MMDACVTFYICQVAIFWHFSTQYGKGWSPYRECVRTAPMNKSHTMQLPACLQQQSNRKNTPCGVCAVLCSGRKMARGRRKEPKVWALPWESSPPPCQYTS